MWNRKKKLVLVLVVGVVLVYGFHRFVMYMGLSQRYSHGVGDISSILYNYIQVTGGEFPNSEEELIARGFIRKVVRDGEDMVEFYPVDPDEPDGEKKEEAWREAYIFEQFNIAYGIKYEDLEVKDGRLYDKVKEEEVLLFQGERHYILDSFYRRSSVSLYELMGEYRN